jgi:predicted permease
MNQTNTVFIVALAIIGFGYFIKKKNIVSEQEGKVVSKLLMHTTFPALVFITSYRLKFESNLLLLPFLSIAFSVLSMFTASLFFKSKERASKALLIMASGGFNLGLFAYPLIEGIWGQQGMVYAAMFDLGNSFAVFGIVYGTGVYFLEENDGISIKGSVLNALKKVSTLAPLRALILGLILNFLNIPLHETFVEIIDVLAKGNKVIVMLLMGIYLNLTMSKAIFKNVIQVLLIRYAWGLALGFLCYYFLPVEQLYRNVLLIAFIIPVGMTLLPFVDDLGYDASVASVFVNLSMLISFAMMWYLVTSLHLA